MAPDWLKPQISPAWFERYGERIENYHLPKVKAKRETLGATIGEDGYTLLASIYQTAT